MAIFKRIQITMPATKICKLCGIRFRGTKKPDEIYCAMCFVKTCDVPDDTEEQFLKLVNEANSPRKVPPKINNVVKFKIPVIAKPKVRPCNQEVNNNDVPVTASSSSDEEADETDGLGHRGLSRGGLTRSNSVRDRIKAFEEIQRRASTGSYDRRKSQSVRRSLPSTKSMSMEKPASEKNPCAKCIVTKQTSTRTENVHNTIDEIASDRVVSLDSNANARVAVSKSNPKPMDSTAKGKFTAPKSTPQSMDSTAKRRITAPKSKPQPMDSNANGRLTTPKPTPINSTPTPNIRVTAPRRSLQSKSWNPKAVTVVRNNDIPVTASSSSEDEGDENEDVLDGELGNSRGLTRSNSVRDRIKAFEEIQRRASTGSYDKKKLNAEKPGRLMSSMRRINT